MKLPKSWEETCQKQAEAVKRMQQHPLSLEEFIAQSEEVMTSDQPLKSSQRETEKED